MSQENRNKLLCPNCGIEVKGERKRNYDIHKLPYEGDLIEVITCRKCDWAEEVDQRVKKW